VWWQECWKYRIDWMSFDFYPSLVDSLGQEQSAETERSIGSSPPSWMIVHSGDALRPTREFTVLYIRSPAQHFDTQVWPKNRHFFVSVAYAFHPLSDSLYLHFLRATACEACVSIYRKATSKCIVTPLIKSYFN